MKLSMINYYQDKAVSDLLAFGTEALDKETLETETLGTIGTEALAN